VERGWWCEESCDEKSCPIWKSELLQRYGRASCYFLRLVVWWTSEQWVLVFFQRH